MFKIIKIPLNKPRPNNKINILGFFAAGVTFSLACCLLVKGVQHMITSDNLRHEYHVGLDKIRQESGYGVFQFIRLQLTGTFPKEVQEKISKLPSPSKGVPLRIVGGAETFLSFCSAFVPVIIFHDEVMKELKR